MFEHSKKSCEALILLGWDSAYNQIISKKLRESSFPFSLCAGCFTWEYVVFFWFIFSEVIVSYNHEALLMY
ncbi:hypothetical protein IG612_13365 [Pectobacterium sp. FL60-S17]|uniref:Uncharacterized protein n=1 Tax=Pectobacterium quasiaquaticum TaxID=2774015 RepID=A0A9Q2I7C9_9GAMM|nr:hypothetical protein [Pectobacterium quasiaquaticum]MBE5203577.1 hypothetical protein [Pectobacterium quasiaquaticum]MBE5212048.1 hypothetical protein [Pectobacterium quasiaquaticum]MBE5222138.1 hypothetical protein [Pectobacterium quasiaquaticum]URG50243.1 hypothetical protein IG609_006920 [Pectobacterium quasiaquaticum]